MPELQNQPEPTMWEIMRILKVMSADISDMSAIMAETYVRKDVYQSDQKAIELEEKTHIRRIGALEDSKTWIVRMVGATAFSSLVGLVLYVGQLLGHGPT